MNAWNCSGSGLPEAPQQKYRDHGALSHGVHVPLLHVGHHPPEPHVLVVLTSSERLQWLPARYIRNLGMQSTTQSTEAGF